jgi:hypothetical protein
MTQGTRLHGTDTVDDLDLCLSMWGYGTAMGGVVGDVFFGFTCY